MQQVLLASLAAVASSGLTSIVALISLTSAADDNANSEAKYNLDPDRWVDCRQVVNPTRFVWWALDGKSEHGLVVNDPADAHTWLTQLRTSPNPPLVDPVTHIFEASGSCGTFDKWTNDREDLPGKANKPVLKEIMLEAGANTGMYYLLGGWYNNPPTNRGADGWSKDAKWAICYAKQYNVTMSPWPRREYADCERHGVPGLGN